MAGGGWQACRFEDDADLSLRNARADALQDSEGAWPAKIELDGFTYGRFGGLGAGAEADVARRGARWFIDWLRRDEPYTRQPYHQCARVLGEMGHPEMAARVLYAGRERERRELFRWRRPPSRQLRPDDRIRRLRRLVLKPRVGLLRQQGFFERVARFAGLGLLRATIGYGYGGRLLWRPAMWSGALIMLGLLMTYLGASAPGCGTAICGRA